MKSVAKKQFLRTTWVDNSGLIRAKATRVHTGTQPPRHEVSLSFADQAMLSMSEEMARGSGLGAVGAVRLVADVGTYSQLPYARSSIRVMGDMFEGDAPWAHCPRECLRRAVRSAAALGLRLRAAFEMEFYLFSGSGGQLTPADRSLYAQSAPLDSHDHFLTELCEALEFQHVAPEAVHAEAGPGQMELVLAHDEPLAAADAVVVCRETVRAIAARCGLAACFLPKPLKGASGSGMHIHLSLWKAGVNITANSASPSQISDQARHFIGGLLKHREALLALTCPTVNSTHRLQDSTWSGSRPTWGYEDKEACVRVPVGLRGITNFEFKAIDATCNPYLALSGVIAAGLHGIEVAEEPSRIEFGLHSPIPTIKECIGSLRRNEVLGVVLGEPLVRSYAAVRVMDAELADGLSQCELVELLANRY